MLTIELFLKVNLSDCRAGEQRQQEEGPHGGDVSWLIEGSVHQSR